MHAFSTSPLPKLPSSACMYACMCVCTAHLHRYCVRAVCVDACVRLCWACMCVGFGMYKRLCCIPLSVCQLS